MKTLIITTIAACMISGAASAASMLSFTLDNQGGSDSSETDVTIEDITGGVKISFSVNDPVNNADIYGVFFDIDGYSDASGKVSGLTVDGVTGTYGNPVTDVAFNTGSIGGLNVNGSLNPGEFDVIAKIGSQGSSSDYWDNFMITVLGTGLDVTDFYGSLFAVRGQSVGQGCDFGVDGCDGSSKQFGMAGYATDPDDPSPVPLPAAGWMLLAGVGGLTVMRRKRKSA